ncbi:MAG TPA: type I 3-dehydroquinate dehydratase [Candidatus Brocadiales bacterium]|nr:type I 3-dehydroquinate dehydratase [Candidatus Brocadiales bacterium]
MALNNKCLICIPITAATNEAAIEDMAAASEYADVLELRLDYIPNPDINKLLKHSRKPVIVTNRPKREGGRFSGNENSRLQLLTNAMELGADYIDVEHDSVQHVLNLPYRGCKIIVSYHNFLDTPLNLDEIYKELCRTGAHIVKLAVFANDMTDNVRVFQLLKSASLPTIALCMGEVGLISRILAQKFGSYMTFASLEEGKESAPGQITVHELINLYRFKKTNTETKIYGLIGNPVAHSISPAIHNAAFAEKGLNWVYIPFKTENIATVFSGLKKIDIQGCSVTIPHKQSIMELLDEIDPLARRIGAVNTVVNRNGKFWGYNTDCTAALIALKEAMPPHPIPLPRGERRGEGDFSLKGKTVLVVGAGGASRAIAFGLHKEDADVIITNRTYEKAEMLGRDIGCKYCKMQELDNLQIDVLVNATSVGMYPNINEMPVPANVLKSGMVVFDIVYNPLETRLLLEAKHRGCITIDGLAMFINQAAAQFELWTGQKAPKELMAGVAYNKLVISAE